jgi:Na+-translocating ferredoxin:NAD+ oxidoreductase subunit B
MKYSILCCLEYIQKKGDMMANDVYKRLRKFYDRLPGGFPETDTGVEIKILHKMYTPEEAKIVLSMGAVPEPASEIAKRAGKEPSEVSEKLEEMANRGIIFRLPVEGNPLFMVINFLIGAWEGQIWTKGDREFAELANSYFPYIAKEWSSLKTQQTRVIPVNSSVDASSAVKPYDQIRDLVAAKDKIAVARCTCAIDTELLGGACDYPVERCISFGMNADNLIALNLGREIGQEELSALLDMGEEKGLVLNVGNAKDIDFICMCCHCCCVLLKLLRFGGKPGDQVQSSFYAAIDPETCTACGTCEERCQINAVIDGDTVGIDTTRCIGCGVCVSTCPEDAITLIAKPESEINDTFGQTLQQILVERGMG